MEESRLYEGSKSQYSTYKSVDLEFEDNVIPPAHKLMIFILEPLILKVLS